MGCDVFMFTPTFQEDQPFLTDTIDNYMSCVVFDMKGLLYEEKGYLEDGIFPETSHAHTSVLDDS